MHTYIFVDIRRRIVPVIYVGCELILNKFQKFKLNKKENVS